jgi:hypothetical protein
MKTHKEECWMIKCINLQTGKTYFCGGLYSSRDEALKDYYDTPSGIRRYKAVRVEISEINAEE